MEKNRRRGKSLFTKKNEEETRIVDSEDEDWEEYNVKIFLRFFNRRENLDRNLKPKIEPLKKTLIKKDNFWKLFLLVKSILSLWSRGLSIGILGKILFSLGGFKEKKNFIFFFGFGKF